MKIRAGYEISYDCPQPILIMIASNSFAQSQMARTVDITTACQNEDDFSRYAC
jgi:hypothetical protein